MINYYSYIKSQAWKNKRLEFLARKFYGKCTCCAENIKEHEVVIHHLRYDNLGKERMNDLVAICRACHNAIHFEEGEKLELTADTTWGRYSKLRFKLQEMHNKRVKKAKNKNEELRKGNKTSLAKNLARRERKRKARLEKKWNHPNFNKEKKKFEYNPRNPPKKKTEEEVLKDRGIKILGVRKK